MNTLQFVSAESDSEPLATYVILQSQLGWANLHRLQDG